MRFLLLRNEESVKDVANKAYKGLTAKTRKQAEAALLKSNPELKKFKSVRKGFIVRIPTILEGEKPDHRNSVDPIEEITQELSNSLELFEKSFSKKYSELEIKQKTTIKYLKAANKELKTLPNGEAAAKTLKKHLADSKNINEKNNKLGLEALEILQKTVAAIDH